MAVKGEGYKIGASANNGAPTCSKCGKMANTVFHMNMITKRVKLCPVCNLKRKNKQNALDDAYAEEIKIDKRLKKEDYKLKFEDI